MGRCLIGRAEMLDSCTQRGFFFEGTMRDDELFGHHLNRFWCVFQQANSSEKTHKNKKPRFEIHISSSHPSHVLWHAPATHTASRSRSLALPSCHFYYQFFFLAAEPSSYQYPTAALSFCYDDGDGSGRGGRRRSALLSPSSPRPRSRPKVVEKECDAHEAVLAMY